MLRRTIKHGRLRSFDEILCPNYTFTCLSGHPWKASLAKITLIRCSFILDVRLFLYAFDVFCLYKYARKWWLERSFPSKASAYCRPRKQNLFFKFHFWTKKSLFLWKILVVLVFKKGGRAPKGMDFQIENPRCGLDLRLGTFFEEIGQRLL